MRIRTKLLVLILVPLLAVAGVAAVGFGQQSVRSERAEDTELFTLERSLISRAVFAIEEERLHHVFNPNAAIDDEIHVATTAILTPTENAIGGDALWATFEEALALVDQARTEPGLEGANTYRTAIISLSDFSVRLEGSFLEPEDTARDEALFDLFAFFEAQDEAWLGYFGASPEDFSSMAQASSRFGEVEALRKVTAVAVTDQDFEPLSNTFTSATQNELQDFQVLAANGLLANRIDVTAEDVGPVLLEHRAEWSPVIDAALDDLVANVDQQGQDADSVRSLFALLGLVGFLLLAGIVFVIYRSIANPLESLLERADSVATKELPELIEVLRTADRDDPLPTATPIVSESSDEIGELIDAFNEVQLTAYALATEQALGRRHVADMFVNLGRRNQQLLQRILGLLTKLENAEEDPDTLRKLFELDNIVTRMRRNAESLLVLAGAQTPRQWTRPVAIEDAVRAAFGEVEGYERIEIAALADARVRGSLVADLAHLLAELLENAVRFSDPSTPVLVSGQFDKGNYLITVFDQGVGMSPADLDENNRRITDPPSLDQAPTKFLGLFVVGRLAERHEISVRLVEAPGRGIMARVEIPSALLHQEEESVSGSGTEALSPIAATPALPETSPLEVDHDPDTELEALALEAELDLPAPSDDDLAIDTDLGLSVDDSMDDNTDAGTDSDDLGALPVRNVNRVETPSSTEDHSADDHGADHSVEHHSVEHHTDADHSDAADDHELVAEAIASAFDSVEEEPVGDAADQPTPVAEAPAPPVAPAAAAADTGLPTRTPQAAASAHEAVGGLPSRQRGAALEESTPQPARRKDDPEDGAAGEAGSSDEQSGDDAGQFSSLMSAFSTGVSRGLAESESETDDYGKGES